MGKPELPDGVPQPLVTREELVRRLLAALPSKCVLYAPEELKPYECDGLSAFREVPWVVALPENEEQVRHVMRTCNEARVPVVARGAGTGLSGGALPHPLGVTLAS